MKSRKRHVPGRFELIAVQREVSGHLRLTFGSGPEDPVLFALTLTPQHVARATGKADSVTVGEIEKFPSADLRALALREKKQRTVCASLSSEWPDTLYHGQLFIRQRVVLGRSFTLPRKRDRLLAPAVQPRPSTASRVDTRHIGRPERPRRSPPEASQWLRRAFRSRTDTLGFPYSRALTIVQTYYGPLSILHCTSPPEVGLFRQC